MPRTLARLMAPLAALVLAGFPAAVGATPRPVTPIQHLVVIFQENVSFDHYFGTYPNAANPPGEPRFAAADGHAVGQRADTPARCTAQPELRQPVPPRPRRRR